MSFYFRKLRTFRLMPTAKRSLGFGFSTRANQNEREKNVNNDNTSRQTVPPMHPSLSIDSEGNVFGGHFKEEMNLFSDTKDTSCLVAIVPPTSAVVPLTLYELQSVIDHKSAVKRRHSLTIDLGSRSKDILDLFSDSLRAVLITSDDILIDNAKHSSESICERLPVDILTVHPWENSAFDTQSTTGTQECSTSPLISGFDNFNLCSPDFSMPGVTEDPAGIPEPSSSQTVYYSSPHGPGGGSGGVGDHGPSSKDVPSPEQMHNIRGKLENLVINLFKSRQDYTILHKNIKFENNLFGDNQVSSGTSAYAFALLKLRFRVHARYSSTDMEILNVSTLEQNGVIRIHWRLKAVPQTQLLKFWRLFQIKKDDVEWLEAFSYFHVGKDGLVHKHRIDRMLPDNERNTNKLTNKLQHLLNPAKPLVS